MSTPRALKPLRNPAYRWLAAALVASMIGAGIWMVALVWQIVAIGGGAAELSLVAGASAVAGHSVPELADRGYDVARLQFGRARNAIDVFDPRAARAVHRGEWNRACVRE